MENDGINEGLRKDNSGVSTSNEFENPSNSELKSDDVSSPKEIFKTKDLSYSAPPHRRRALDHSITAPATVRRNLFPDNKDPFPDNKEAAYSRSMTEKWWSRSWIPRHELKLDRLSEREKQKLIVELVKIQSDGTVEVDLSKSAPSELFEYQSIEGFQPDMDYIVTDSNRAIPKLNIAVLVVGTRGDVQPFLAISKRLQEFGHHVRLATHANFRSFVESAGVDFYPLGGDPRVLAGYMARNKGLIPSAPGEISIQRKQLKAIIESLLPACTEPDLKNGKPFRAQAIIANPPAYGHAHVAEALGVPLHMFFTMPWTPTSEFPSPLARVPQSAGYWLSYIVVDLLIWWGIRGYINDFRKKLNLAPIAYFSMYRGSISHFPTGYMWSPHVVSKPSDWGSLVDVVGYCFLNLGSKYQPPEEFIRWIGKGTSPPIYIGFGSMPLEDPAKTTNIILEALRKTGQRGIIDRGWGDLGTFPDIPDDVFLLVDCPHDWLFPQCAAVVHHGGAGTTATGLRAGCPTTIVPFFGDQYFWGDRIYHRGLGPNPIPISQLTVEALSDAINFMLQPEVKARAMDLAKLIENEDGVANAVDAFHRHLPPDIALSSTPPSKQEDEEYTDPIQWFFTQIALYCGCGS
ncbi:Glycosyl transferase, family 28 [Artemisia annua]|uniref:Glycosyl transferase, family 28 n=1 Tax=Artemisia annua TaxID=35608 RepID=A0A2U1MEF4_ARTAN|nr:Glycosyl transferase, family 28 [Artemisia annua]